MNRDQRIKNWLRMATACRIAGNKRGAMEYARQAIRVMEAKK